MKPEGLGAIEPHDGISNRGNPTAKNVTAEWRERIIIDLTELGWTRIALAATKMGLTPETFVLRAIRRELREIEIEELVEMTMSVAAMRDD